MRQSGRWLLAMGFICMVALLVASCDKETSEQTPTEETPTETTNVTLFVSLDEEFVLHKNQSAVIESEDLALVTIYEFYNSPTPEGARSDWSGVGIDFEYRHAGEVIRGINYKGAFGYKVTIIDTDYETFARLKVAKIP